MLVSILAFNKYLPYLRQKYATCNVYASAIHLQKLPGIAHPIIHTDPDREMCSTMYLQSFILFC